MIKNYLKIAFRNLQRYRMYAFVNMAGLAVGMTCCMLILLYVRDELSYDRYHENAEQIHRLVRSRSAYTAAPMGPALAAEMPGVRQAARIKVYQDVLVHDGGEKRFIESVFAADTSFFDIFTVPFLRGTPEAALSRPDGLVLTASAAEKYFGREDAMGKTLIVVDDEPFALTVTGVIEDLPAASHVRFDLLASFKLVEQSSSRLENWTTNWLFTYLLLDEATSGADVEARLPALFERHTGEAWDHFRIQPLLDIHLYSRELDLDIAPQGNIAYVFIFSAVGLLVLLIGCINFMNLATARSAGRAKEVGMRKVLGARRRQLVQQFLGESLVMALGALVMAVGLALLLLPAFGQLAEKDLALSLQEAGYLAVAFFGLALVVGLLAGSYPAFFLSAFAPIDTLKGTLRTGRAARFLRQGLVVFQFTISTALIVGTLVVVEQLDYVKNAGLGFDKEQVVVLSVGAALEERYEAAKQEIRRHPNVLGVSASGNVPGHGVSDFYYHLEGLATSLDALPGWDTYFVDADFVETLRLEVVQGRNFSRDLVSDEQAFILNEAAVARAVADVGEAWASPIGKQMSFYLPGAEGWQVFKSGTVVGVVKDFHYRSLHEEIGPLVLQVFPETFGELLVKVGTDDLAGTLAFLEQRWRDLDPTRPFDYYFLDQDFDRLYRAEDRVGQVVGAFAVPTIVIACLGLFGLAAFMAEQRTKEIGVRKVLGATIPGVLLLLSKEFVKLIMLAFVVAAPLAYFAMSRWLESFAYRIEISGGIFLMAGLTALGMALLTVSYQSIRAALTDPVESLRYE